MKKREKTMKRGFKRRLLVCFIVVISIVMGAVPSLAAGGTVQRNNEGSIITNIENIEPVIVTYLENEPKTLYPVDDLGVTVRDADGIVPFSANHTKSLNLAVGKSYSFGPFYLGMNSPWDSNAGDMIDITVSGVSSGKYKVIVEGIPMPGNDNTYKYESAEYSSAKTFTIKGQERMGYTVTVINTSAEKLVAKLNIITYKS